MIFLGKKTIATFYNCAYKMQLQPNFKKNIYIYLQSRLLNAIKVILKNIQLHFQNAAVGKRPITAFIKCSLKTPYSRVLKTQLK